LYENSCRTKFSINIVNKIFLSRNIPYTVLHLRWKRKLNDLHILPLFNSEILQLGYAAPVSLRHKRDKYLREVHPGDEEGERYHQHEQDPLIGTEFADVRQQIIEVYILGLLRIIFLVAALEAILDRKSGLGRGRGRQSVRTRVLRGQIPEDPAISRGEFLLRRHLAFGRDLRSSP